MHEATRTTTTSAAVALRKKGCSRHTLVFLGAVFLAAGIALANTVESWYSKARTTRVHVKQKQSDDYDDDNLLHFWPNQALDAYRQQHSIEAIEYDIQHNSNQHRQYAVLYYYCPKRAGNILHSLFSQVLWSIITNRTMLWHYDTDFSDPNTEDDCNNVLERAAWIPRYADYNKTIASKPRPVSMDDHLRWSFDMQHKVVIFPMIKDIMKLHDGIFRNEWSHDPMNQEETAHTIFDMGEDARQRTTMLYFYGLDYLMGMLYRELFSVHVDVLPRLHRQGEPATFSVALHSRHTVLGDDGSYIQDEIKCLKETLVNVTNQVSCRVYLMSDRPTTVRLLAAWIQQHYPQCTSISTDSSIDETTMAHTEHGPHPGKGFIRDIELASRARNAVIGDVERSSFMLLMELVKYSRRIEDWKQGLDGYPHTSSPVYVCRLPGRYGIGYDYGPGTPTFKSPRHHAPLAPVSILEEYKARHNATSQLSTNVLVSRVACNEIDSTTSSRIVLNGKYFVCITSTLTIFNIPFFFAQIFSWLLP